MLGKTAGGVFWMYRHLERSENNARLIEAGFRIALTRSSSAQDEWGSVIVTAGVDESYRTKHKSYSADDVIDFILRDRDNPSSVMSAIEAARNNARLVRTAITREVWEAVNESWITLQDLLAKPVSQKNLPNALSTIRRQAALVRAALHGTMLRNDIYDFARLGTFIERADATARILDVKYHVLLPSIRQVGSSLDNVQWEVILRSVSALRSYRWLNNGEVTPKGIAEFLILDKRMPRSLAFCHSKVNDNLGYLASDYNARHPSHEMAKALKDRLEEHTIEQIFEEGLHEFIMAFIRDNNALATQIETDYRFLA